MILDAFKLISMDLVGTRSPNGNQPARGHWFSVDATGFLWILVGVQRICCVFNKMDLVISASTIFIHYHPSDISRHPIANFQSV